MKKLGLIINPIAGMGGRVGLKGTDGADILAKAESLGAKPRANQRTIEALNELVILKDEVELITCPNQMGQNALVHCGFKPKVIGSVSTGSTSSIDTTHAAKKMLDMGTDLILFAGGDGTARDIYSAVKDSQVVLGVPAGVKIHSAVYACNPTMAGKLASLFLQGKTRRTVDREVMDIDEKNYRRGILSAKLYGYLKIPFEKKYVQNLKTGSPATEAYYQQAIATDIVENMNDDFYYIIGPGTTTRAIMQKLDLGNSLLGIDIVHKKKLIAQDLNELQLLNKINGKKCKLIITPIGGQGYIFGRGNQQLSPDVLKVIGKDHVIIVATAQKINSLQNRSLLVDTGDRETDLILSDYFRIVTGYHESRVYKVTRLVE